MRWGLQQETFSCNKLNACVASVLCCDYPPHKTFPQSTTVVWFSRLDDLILKRNTDVESRNEDSGSVCTMTFSNKFWPFQVT